MATEDLRFLADENFNNDLMRALLRRLPHLDIIRAQDTVIAGEEDPALLAWAADEGRILLTHDARTIPRFAFDRVRAGQPMPGVVVVAMVASRGEVLDDLFVLIAASSNDEWHDRVHFVPLH
jgi:predicted nuclease of predicted toxin-antitoxin system